MANSSIKTTFITAVLLFIPLALIANSPFLVKYHMEMHNIIERTNTFLELLEKIDFLIMSIMFFTYVGSILWNTYASIYNANVRININHPRFAPHSQARYHPQGGYVAYRYFKINNDNELTSLYPDEHGRYTIYKRGYLQSSYVPTRKNEAGIWAAKTPDSPALDVYKEEGEILGEVWLYGRVVPQELGIRALFCQVLNLQMQDGTWINYQEWENMYVKKNW